MNARWYNPGIGRFLTEDTYPGTSLNLQSQNRYSYVMNNPVNMWDPTGNIPSWVGQDSYFTWLDNGNYLNEAYILMDYNSSSSGRTLINEVNTAKTITETYRERISESWDYYYLKINYDEVKNEETGETEYNYTGYTDSLVSFSDSYYSTMIIEKKAADIAAANKEKINNYGSAPDDSPGMIWSNRAAKQYKETIISKTFSKGNVTEKVTSTPITSQLMVKLNKKGDTETLKDITTSVKAIQKKFGLPQTGTMNGTVAKQLSNLGKSTSNEGTRETETSILGKIGNFVSGKVEQVEQWYKKEEEKTYQTQVKGAEQMLVILGVKKSDPNYDKKLQQQIKIFQDSMNVVMGSVGTEEKIVGEIHHIASNKSIVSGFTAAYETIFKKASMTLEDAANKVFLEGHKGAHTNVYKQYVLDYITKATKGLNGDAAKKALTEALRDFKNQLIKNPKMPYKGGK